MWIHVKTGSETLAKISYRYLNFHKFTSLQIYRTFWEDKKTFLKVHVYVGTVSV